MARKVSTAPIPDLLAGYDASDPHSLGVVEDKVRNYIKLFYLKMNRAQEPFIRIKNKRGRMPRTRLFESGNQVGKTSIGVAEDIAHAMGFRPWLEKDDPDYKINVRVPNNGIVGCEVAGQTLAQRIEPEFMSLIPEYCGIMTSRYSDGSIKSITIANDFNGKPCGSTIHFRSYVQPAESYEGTVLDWIHFDEPPPQAILTAATRGLMSTNGPSWYTMTPLKEAYIYDLLSLHGFNNGGEDQEIAVFRGSTWDNCQDWCRQCDVTIPENDPERLQPGQVRPVDNCPKCGQVMGFLPRAGIENYLKKITDPDEREAREEGKWKHLSGLVYKELDREKHIYTDFPIPSDWMRIEAVDPADARPTRWIFGAVSPEDIMVNGKQANRIYWYDYLLASGSIESIARQVKVKRAEHNYREPAMVIIDVKFAAAHKPLHGETFSSWEEKLSDAGINKMVMSRSNPGDVSLGHKAVKEYLADHFSMVRGTAFPGMMFAREGCKGDMGPTQSMFNYQWEDGKDKPQEQYKDFPDTIRYAALEQPVYARPVPELDQEFARMILNREASKPEPNPMYLGLSIRV
jgi:phage terminase large subunit-like protein